MWKSGKSGINPAGILPVFLISTFSFWSSYSFALPWRRWAWTIGGGLALSIASALADESSHDPSLNGPRPERAPQHNLIQDTQRGLKELPALSRGLSDSKPAAAALALPSLQAPGALDSPVPAAPRTRRKPEELRRQRETRNWLLEAMRKHDSAKSSSSSRHARDAALAALTPLSGAAGEGGANADNTPEKDVVTQVLREEAEAARARANAAPAEPPRIDNPLDAFLSAWMTPRDYSLLAPAARPGESGAVVPSSSGVASRDSLVFGGAGGLERSGAQSSENPYLHSLPNPGDLGAGHRLESITPAVAPPPTATVTAPQFGVSPSSNASPPIGVAPPTKTPSDTRYQPPPQADSKYFPQLKRF